MWIPQMQDIMTMPTKTLVAAVWSSCQVVPSLGSGVGEGRIELNESFKLHVTLLKEISIKGGDRDGDAFQKNCIEFNLYEPRRDKTVEGQPLGTAIINLAEMVLLRRPFERSRMSSSSSREVLTREASIDCSGVESVSTLTSEEYAEEAEIASFTDDDGSSHSLVAVSSSANGSNCGSLPQGEKKSTDLNEKQVVESLSDSKASLSHSSTDLSSDLAWLSRKLGGSGNNKLSTSSENEITENSQNPYVTEHIEPVQQMERILASSESGGEIYTPQSSEEGRVNSDLDQEGFPISQITDESKSFMNTSSHCSSYENASTPVGNRHEDARSVVTESGSYEGENSENYQERRQEFDANNRENYKENEQVQEIVEDEEGDDAMKNDSEESDVNSADMDSYGAKSNILNNERLKHVKSVRSSAEPNRVNGSVRGGLGNERKDREVQSTDTSTILLQNKLHKLEQRVKIAEGELREAAAIEVGLYSVVVEHGSSTNKVHAPARRLSRACGDDVPRLTFWLSNSLVLRATIRKFQREQKAVSRDKKKISSPLKWEVFSSNGIRDDFCESFGNWEDPRTFTRALQRTEAWIFSRIVESIWWQTLTPHMQSGAAKEIRESMNSLISKIMEQCVTRLDVAMFNAILRESGDEIPSDTISDPISDANVLPIPTGKASFGAGAQLKNTIGNYSRWLTDLFDIDDGESLEDVKEADNNEKDGSKELDTSSKSFYLLNALSDLMMLPKDMLLSRTTRKEVCPAFGPSLNYLLF
ncbi:hypothetical protein RND71_011170 [Anisodus tanguticus]|uniref:Uncharacterized protein n=1 Tax=Anisodus tanguticus TaxID=243964 RepID=A0AAE1SB07_9SOLA|nr:hypothetical protein RND71_011170 [Anisodus tanguticus]